MGGCEKKQIFAFTAEASSHTTLVEPIDMLLQNLQSKAYSCRLFGSFFMASNLLQLLHSIAGTYVSALLDERLNVGKPVVHDAAEPV
jgi:hypothetical protein